MPSVGMAECWGGRGSGLGGLVAEGGLAGSAWDGGGESA